SELKKNAFSASEIRQCYVKLSHEPPANITQQLNDLSTKKPKEILKTRDGYSLEVRVRSELESKYGYRQTTTQIHNLLTELPSRVSNLDERSFLAEAIICLRYGAPRAAIIMCWNLTFDHLCNFILASHLSTFNSQWPIRFKKHHDHSDIKAIIKKDDFMEA